MTAYYNEVDPFAAQWLRNLMAGGHIAPGMVDERSIEDVLPADLVGYDQCHFFAGIGIWSAALRAAGWPDDRPIWTGSCPCQPFSQAGKGRGFADERHLWPAWHWLISQLLPITVFGEQVAGSDGFAWLDLVQTDMEALAYTCGAAAFPAASVGAPHGRHRVYFVADARGASLSGSVAERRCVRGVTASAFGEPCNRGVHPRFLNCADPDAIVPLNGHPRPVGIVRAFGNAICLPQAQAFIEAYSDCCPSHDHLRH